MSRKLNRYMVLSKDGRILCQGTATDCCEYLKICKSVFYDKAESGKKENYRGKYRIMLVEAPTDKEIDNEYERLCKQWDDFVAPIREKYGVPVYKKEKKHDKR